MISVVIIAKNEEKKIKLCLESLEWCDEKVVVIDESTDKTAEIAKGMGAKVIAHKLNQDFAQMRNFALKIVKGDWVLFVDSDERIPIELAKEIQQAIKTENRNGFYIKRIDFFMGKELRHGETARVKLLRLGKKEKGKWIRPVHEFWQIEGNVGELKNPILHYSCDNLTDFWEKISRYSYLHALALEQEGKKSSLGRILFYPVGKFMVNWIFKFGFLDGVQGLIMAFGMSLHSFLASSHLYLKCRK